jgi:2-C-methyl-D-erythritol 4-phosphate cytidylyltransferase
MKIIIPASGAGSRFGGEIPKQFLFLGGEPILKRTLSIFSALESVEEIIVAVCENYFEEVENYKIPKVKIVSGGETRAESVFFALQSLAPTKIVLIHDGIRPLVTKKIIEDVAFAAEKFGAAVACSRVTDTIKKVDANGKIISTPDRNSLRQAQTPQGFTYENIFRAYRAAEADGVLRFATDDSSLAERIGIPVQIVEACPSNIKITTQTDLTIAEGFVTAQTNIKFAESFV